jgi:glyoxylase-like metal-dependent hydrolase (beta-lactamase superfamily II)
VKINIHAIQTGTVDIKTAHRVRKPGGLIRVFADSTWTEWLPIYTWVIDHPEGVIVVDTGETSKSSDPNYYPHWHPYYRFSLRMNVRPEDEVGPQLGRMGITQEDIKTLVLTHFHTDHAGGLHHFPGTEILVSGTDHRLASGIGGRLRGYLPHRWPKWFSPEPIAFEPESFGPFEQSYKVTQAGDVLIVPTPGHTPGHVSVVVNTEDVIFFLAGDTSYSESLLIKRIPDGVSSRASVAIDTMDRILRLADSRPLVYLPTHDPESVDRLTHKRTLGESLMMPTVEGGACA